MDNFQKQMNTNVFGQMAVTRAILPYMRERREGTLVFIGSIVQFSTYPTCGAYCSSKRALDGNL